MPASRHKDQLIITSPAFDMTDDRLPPTSGNFDFSFEFTLFLYQYNNGKWDFESDTYKRCINIQKRKGCYGLPLFDAFQLLTEHGELVWQDAKSLHNRFTRYFNGKHGFYPTLDNISKMDEIILYGSLPPESIVFLDLCWQIAPQEQKTLKQSTQLRKIPNVTLAEVDGRMGYEMSSLRGNWHYRTYSEPLLKFGLLDMVQLPKKASQKGKGRSPIALCITPLGIKFYEDYLMTFDPQGRTYAKYLEFKAVMDEDEDSRRSGEVAENLNKLEGFEVTNYVWDETSQTMLPVGQDQASAEVPAQQHIENKVQGYVADLLPPPVEIVPDQPKLLPDLSTLETQPTKPTGRLPTRAELRAEKTREQGKSKKSDSSDVVDGEDLKELFG